MFDLFKIKLSGLHLIEASAGTGKTYSLCGLFFRLFLEAKINFRAILLITFTNLATEELQNRIYHYLEKALSLIENNPTKELEELIPLAENDQILKYLLQHCKRDQEKLKMIKEAFLNFHEIAILTLDGFWHKISQDYGFEIATLGEKKLIETSQTNEIITDIINRYYQKFFLKKDDEWSTINEILFQKDPKILITLRKTVLEHHLKDSFQIYRTKPDFDLADFKKQFAEITVSITNLLQSLAIKLPQQKEAFLSLFTAQELNKNKYRQIESDLQKIFNCFSETNFKSFLQNCLKRKILVKTKPDKPNKLDRLSLDYLENALKKNVSLPNTSTEVWEILKDLEQCNNLLKNYFFLLEEFSLYHLQTLFEQVKKEYSSAKEHADWYDFEDIPNTLLKHLSDSSKNTTGGSSLQKKIFEQFHAVMIDEFQDTNQNQYQIINKLFIEPISASIPSSSQSYNKAIFLIGDPKQSIYAFRKADILSYLKVKQNSAFTLHTQDINWRSTLEIITAQNTLFKVNNAFLYPDISYHPVYHPSDSQKINTQKKSPESPTNLKLWVFKESETKLQTDKEDISSLDSDSNTKRESPKEFYQQQFAMLLVQSIKEKLTNQIAPEKIAVLVETTKDIFFIKKKCLENQIPCIASHQSETLISETTLALFQLLSTIAKCEDTRLLKGLLVSPLFSFSVEEVKIILSSHSKEWQQMISWCKNLKEIWLNHSLSAMIKVLLAPIQNQCTLLQKKLLSYRQRQIEDFTISSDFLIGEYFDNKTPFFLLKDLNTKIKKAQLQSQTKTTSSRILGAIQIMTIHQSKGLEFDFVYLPFAWRMSISSTIYQNKEGLYKANDQQIYFKKSLENYLSNKEQVKIKEYQNQNFYYYFAESLRLFYVALTRAKKEIFIGYGDYEHSCNKQSFSYNPLYYYLHFAKLLANENTDTVQDNLKQHLKQLSTNLDEESILQDLNDTITLAKGVIGKEEFDEFSLSKLPQPSNEKSIGETSTHLEDGDFLKSDFDLETLSEQLIDLPQKDQFYSFSSLLEITSKKEFGNTNTPIEIEDSFLEKSIELDSEEFSEEHDNNEEEEKITTPENKNSTEKNMFTFAAGIDAGNCLHNILEETNFQIFANDSFAEQPNLKTFLKKKIQKQIAIQLEIYQFPLEYKDVIWGILQTLAILPLSTKKEIQLANLQHHHTWRELEFYYSLNKDPLATFFKASQKSSLSHAENFNQLIGYLLDTEENSSVSIKEWQKTLSNNINSDFNSLSTQIATIKNWMHGFIDFIFEHDNKYYFIDWKSNYLGNSLADYQNENLHRTMLKHNYILQHYIYTIALDNYLQKMPNYTYEQNFGGGYYLFLRGLNAQKKDNGIYFFKPPKEKVDFLRKILLCQP